MVPRAGGRKESDAAASDQDFARCGERRDLEYRIYDNGFLFHFSRCVEFEHTERQRKRQLGIVFENGLDSGHLVVVSVDFLFLYKCANNLHCKTPALLNLRLQGVYEAKRRKRYAAVVVGLYPFIRDVSHFCDVDCPASISKIKFYQLLIHQTV